MMYEDYALCSRICKLVDNVLPSPADMSCFPYFLINDYINCSAISIFLSIEMGIQSIILPVGSISTHNMHYSFPALIIAFHQ